ncbi:P-loop containing nucleoside triphosphate hydrolase protein [Scenedesmus sp. NREL 46B-D3]|nr:P-loop containing nucleoside triphosphate hydrolase protein [Scenedesmus sp. NREL 46B-D3]
MKKKGGKQQQGGSPYLLDRNLMPRIEQYALNHDITDVDDVVDYLRRSYKEYQRKQVAALRQMVTKAVQVVQQKGVAKPELQLQARESQHLTAAQREANKAAGSSSEEESSDEGENDSDDEAAAAADDKASGDLDSAAAAELAAATAGPAAAAATPAPAKRTNSGLNSSLLNMYSASKQALYAAAAAAVTPAAQQQQPGSSSSGGNTSDNEASDNSSEPDPNAPPAFAPQHVIAAAAAKAIAAEKAAKAAAAVRKAGKQLPAKQRQEQQAASVPAAGQQAKKSRSAEEAGIGRDSRAVAKRVRRASTAAGGGGAGGGAAGGGQGVSGRKGGSAVTAPRPLHYADLGGVEDVLADIQELIEYPLKHPEVYSWLGVEPPRGVLLHGPPGCGKTALAHAIATECGVPFLRVAAPEVVSGMSGESEARLRQLFLVGREAQEVAPSILFIDEIDAIAPKRDTAQREMERRIVAQMLTCMDDLAAPPAAAAGAAAAAAAAATDSAGAGNAPASAAAEADDSHIQMNRRGHVVVIGATNRPDALDPALRRAGRFDREISLGIPTEAARCQILKVLSRSLRLQGGFDFHAIARRTPGFVGADLAALTKEAAAVAVSRIFSQLEQQRQQRLLRAADDQQQQEPLQTAAAGGGTSGSRALATAAAAAAAVAAPEQQQQQQGPRMGGGPLSAAELSGLAISMSDFEAALPKVQPSVRREGFTTKPDATWDDVGSLEEAFAAMGLSAASGVLLYGPPGCGKTLVAKAVAAESGANFISIKGPELLNKYVGESERAVRQLFARARAAHPCVLFFDEMDALAPRRGSDNNAPAERLVNQLLTEMDGIDGRLGVYVVAATNRPDMIDPALLRPGRLDKVLYVPLPPADGRASILAAAGADAHGCWRAAAGTGAGQVGVRVWELGSERCDGFSGADVAALVKEAAVLALKEAMVAAAAAAAAAMVSSSSSKPGTPSSSDAAADGATAPPAAAEAAGMGGGVPYPLVHLRHFEAALSTVTPSVNRRDRRSYEAMRTRLRGARAQMPAATAAAASAGGGAAAGAAAGEGSGMADADGTAATAAAAVGGGGGKAAGDDMEGTDDAPEPEDPMKD